ncbi:hypothetical protein PF005_g18011 [Phytophthora fragariae]|nr:hypothetical protein PF003_g28406 [Phytophthora fragariae]KAE8932536.1 hypothetical protein PF009_g17441 [Phytophthora fragariae]KAE9093697.1 hypothetical protein PF007_g18035 [Phytophthora fragariae]KAE9133383.1 hypothetical protein PF006_g15032 [Phytophthora fragariae]KAE9193580.1 hypothetical protein PF005_g18011 [Phytophthora fragariae]
MPAPTVDAAPPSAPRRLQKGKRTARKSPSKESSVLEWNPEMVENLMRMRPISTEKCKNKLKWLRRNWAEYNSDMTAIGNQSSPLIEPPRIELMQEYWSGSMGMNGNTLADNEGTGS